MLKLILFTCLVIIFFTINNCAKNVVSNVKIIPPIIGSLDSLKDTIRIATWNIEWFYSSKGPTDNVKQFNYVKEYIEYFKFGIYAVVEISNPDKFSELMSELVNYDGVLSTFSAEQKMGLIYQVNTFEMLEFIAISGLEDASRPPLLVKLKVKKNGLIFYCIVIHAKAFNDLDSYNRRKTFAIGLKEYIESNLTHEKVIIMGDYNDFLVNSIAISKVSPYQNFVNDSSKYILESKKFNATKTIEHTYPSLTSNIDHIILSQNWEIKLIKNSINILEDEVLELHSDYLETVSDHCPLSILIKF